MILEKRNQLCKMRSYIFFGPIRTLANSYVHKDRVGESGVVEWLESKEGDARKEAAPRRKICKQLIPEWSMHEGETSSIKTKPNQQKQKNSNWKSEKRF